MGGCLWWYPLCWYLPNLQRWQIFHFPRHDWAMRIDFLQRPIYPWPHEIKATRSNNLHKLNGENHRCVPSKRCSAFEKVFFLLCANLLHFKFERGLLLHFQSILLQIYLLHELHIVAPIEHCQPLQVIWRPPSNVRAWSLLPSQPPGHLTTEDGFPLDRLYVRWSPWGRSSKYFIYSVKN